MYPGIESLVLNITEEVLINSLQITDVEESDLKNDSKEDFYLLCASFVLNGPVGLSRKIKVPTKNYEKCIRDCFLNSNKVKKSSIIEICRLIAENVPEDIKEKAPYYKKHSDLYPNYIIPNN